MRTFNPEPHREACVCVWLYIRSGCWELFCNNIHTSLRLTNGPWHLSPTWVESLGGPKISRDSMRGVGSQDKATRVGIGANALDNH